MTYITNPISALYPNSTLQQLLKPKSLENSTHDDKYLCNLVYIYPNGRKDISVFNMQNCLENGGVVPIAQEDIKDLQVLSKAKIASLINVSELTAQKYEELEELDLTKFFPSSLDGAIISPDFIQQLKEYDDMCSILCNYQPIIIKALENYYEDSPFKLISATKINDNQKNTKYSYYVKYGDYNKSIIEIYSDITKVNPEISSYNKSAYFYLSKPQLASLINNSPTKISTHDIKKLRLENFFPINNLKNLKYKQVQQFIKYNECLESCKPRIIKFPIFTLNYKDKILDLLSSNKLDKIDKDNFNTNLLREHCICLNYIDTLAMFKDERVLDLTDNFYLLSKAKLSGIITYSNKKLTRYNNCERLTQEQKNHITLQIKLNNENFKELNPIDRFQLSINRIQRNKFLLNLDIRDYYLIQQKLEEIDERIIEKSQWVEEQYANGMAAPRMPMNDKAIYFGAIDEIEAL